MNNSTRRYDTIVIGGGQAGLATGYYLKQQSQNFVILDANARIGDSWRMRWDSLRLFTPARFDGLPGLPFPARPFAFPTKDEMANYLESYATHYELPVQTGIRVDCLTKINGRFIITAGDKRFEADNVIVAMSNWQKPWVPPFSREIDPGIVQLHSSEYKNPSQLRDGGVLIVGAGNSGGEIALDVARSHPTWLSGRDTGHVPFRIDGVAARFLIPILFRLVFHHLLTLNTPMGHKMRSKFLSHGMSLIRTKPKDLAEAGIQRAPRVSGVQNGLPILEGVRVLNVANIICGVQDFSRDSRGSTSRSSINRFRCMNAG